MAREILFSDFECDCGHRGSFCESTVKECQEQGMKRPVSLGDCENAEHFIVFRQGRAIEIECPELGSVPLDAAAEKPHHRTRRAKDPRV
jgi:hypothetical protein